MKYFKIIFITMLLVIIMFIPVNASILTLPELPGEYEDYIIFNGASLYNDSSRIYALTFNNLDNMYVGTYQEYLELVDPYESSYTHHSHDILYFRRNEYDYLEANYYKLVDNEWELKSSKDDMQSYRFGAGANNSIKNTDILYSSKNVIDLTDGSVFFFNGSWMKAGIIRPMLGIIPFLIGLLIVSAGFLKGLQLLFRTLRKA